MSAPRWVEYLSTDGVKHWVRVDHLVDLIVWAVVGEESLHQLRAYDRHGDSYTLEEADRETCEALAHRLMEV